MQEAERVSFLLLVFSLYELMGCELHFLLQLTLLLNDQRPVQRSIFSSASYIARSKALCVYVSVNQGSGEMVLPPSE